MSGAGDNATREARNITQTLGGLMANTAAASDYGHAWVLMEEAIRGFFMEKHLPMDTADEWTNEISAIVSEHLR